jgi:hypothetical protein
MGADEGGGCRGGIFKCNRTVSIVRAKLSVERHEDLTAVTNERNEFGRIPVAEVRSPSG